MKSLSEAKRTKLTYTQTNNKKERKKAYMHKHQTNFGILCLFVISPVIKKNALGVPSVEFIRLKENTEKERTDTLKKKKKKKKA